MILLLFEPNRKPGGRYGAPLGLLLALTTALTGKPLTLQIRATALSLQVRTSSLTMSGR